MGKFIYENSIRVDFDNRVLAHLQVVITTKLRRSEAFSFMWKDDASIGDGRTMVWVHANASLVFKFYGGRRPTLNPAWLEALGAVANSNTGLYVIPEPHGPVRGSGTDETFTTTSGLN